MKFTKNMTEGNIYRSFLSYSLPMLLSSLLSQAYSAVDAVIAGKFISENALGAISATGSYDLLLYALFSGFAAGFGIYIAQQFGKGDYGIVKRDIVNTGILVAVLALIISAASIGFRGPILDYLKIDPLLRPDAEIYFVIYTAGYFLPYLNLLLIQALYALGCTSFSIYVSFIAAAFKIIGNLLSVLVLDLGVAGLAVFSVLSNAAATVCYLVLLGKAFRELPSETNFFRLDLKGIGNTLKYAMPAAVQQMAFSSAALLIAPTINALGAAATTAYNVSTRIYDFATLSLVCVTNAFSCYTAQCLGKGDCRKIPDGIKVGFLLNTLILIPFAFGFALFSKPVTALFFPDGFEGEAYHLTVRYTAFFLPFVFVQLVGHVLHAYMRSLGAINTVLGITIFYGAVRVLATIFLVPGMHLDGAHWAQIISWAVDALISLAIALRFFRTQDQLSEISNRVRKASVKTS